MSRIRIEVLGGANREPRINVSNNTFSSEVFGNLLEANLPPTNVRIVVDFRVPREFQNKSKTAVPGQQFIQDLAFEPGAAGGPARHRPSLSSSGAALHPRFIPVQSSGAALGAGSLLHFQVDCRFLPVTDLVRGFDPEIIKGVDPLVPDPDRPAGTQVRLYENTVGGPRVWVVAFAPANVPPNSKNLHTALFLMPKSPAYTDLTNVNLFSLRRYLLSAPANMPFFIRNFTPADPLGGGEYFTTVTQAAMLEQLEQSGAPVLLALPIPGGSAVVPTGDGTFRELMRSLRRAVHADELAKEAPELPATFRVCASGFSRGADIASDLLLQQQASVDEFYWFDPSGKALGNVSGIQDWLRASDKRRLRLIGTTLNDNMHKIAKALKLPSTRASAMPERGFRRSAIYKAAVSVPLHNTSLTFPEVFESKSAQAPPNSLSDATNIFLSNDNGSAEDPQVFLQTLDSKGRPIQAPVKVGFTPEEIAGKARFGMLNVDRKQPPKTGLVFGERLEGPKGRTLQQFIARFLIGEILDPLNAGDGSVHQWATVGGLGGGGASPRQGFKGFFQICLEAGDLPK